MKQAPPKKCTLCLENVEVYLMVTLTCGDQFCKECLSQYFEIMITSKSIPILCPSLNCRKEISETVLSDVLNPSTMKKYEQYSLDVAIERNPRDYTCCFTPDCPFVFFQSPNDPTTFRCPLCKNRFCLSCQVIYHQGITCTEYQRKLVLSSYLNFLHPGQVGPDAVKQKKFEDLLFKQMLARKEWKRCPGCRAVVDKEDGCDHMICRCGCEFCYHCGGGYPCQCEDE